MIEVSEFFPSVYALTHFYHYFLHFYVPVYYSVHGFLFMIAAQTASTLHGWADFLIPWMNLFWVQWSWRRSKNLNGTIKLSHTWTPEYCWCELSLRLEPYHVGFSSSAAWLVCASTCELSGPVPVKLLTTPARTGKFSTWSHITWASPPVLYGRCVLLPVSWAVRSQWNCWLLLHGPVSY